MKLSATIIGTSAILAAAVAVAALGELKPEAPTRAPGNFEPTRAEKRTIEKALAERFYYPRGVELGSVTGRFEAGKPPYFCGFVKSENEHGGNRRTSIFHGFISSKNFIPMQIASGGTAADEALTICCLRGLFEGDICSR
ncbi:hypothetical protein KZZ07_19765 [Mameliella sp. CS4]|uniref:hypothetical protein n=1 Tax=Mameliella sp. CS4 TaxID=2862329 RepID=UPI001C5E6BC4|nr:hypothetical protein [Mameliella sp. CS4]MBW4984782.1 hypothetical protein [Mameliella sp. CS4]